jgi:hypothetical protein
MSSLEVALLEVPLLLRRSPHEALQGILRMVRALDWLCNAEAFGLSYGLDCHHPRKGVCNVTIAVRMMRRSYDRSR